MSNTDRHPECHMRTALGNCDPIGGFCTSVNEAICEALHKAAEPKEVYCPMASRTCFTNGKEVAWCLTCPHISEEDRDLVKKAIAEPKTGECKTCKRSSDYRWSIGENGTRCPIEEHYALPKDGYCHLYEPYREDGEA